MNAEQLNSARLARWSQNGEARLTLEAASEWIDEIGFCPYVPMGLTGSAPAPSFVEAIVGRPAQAPSAGERERALELLARVIENSSVVPLKLSASLGEQPDFVCSPEVLRFVYALRGDRNFKTGPLTVGNEKVTPLALHCWQAIEQQGPLDVAALQPILGRDITEAAIARALQELWSAMYIFPILRAAGEPAQWELMFRRFPKPVAAGASTGHAEAQSAMISLYLQASVAAREEEILSFLSPLAPQSKLREVIRGLGSMRQLDILDIGGRAHVALQGGLLPEMVAQLSEEFFAAPPATDAVVGEPEIEMEAEVESEAEIESDSEVTSGSGIQIEAVPPPSSRPWRSQPLEESDTVPRSTIKKFTPKKFVPRPASSRPSPGEFAARGGGQDRPSRRPFSGASRPEAGGFSRPAGAYVPRAGSIAASADGRPGASRPRPSGLGRPGTRSAGPGGSGSGRSGPPRYGRDRDSGPSRGPFSRDRAERGPKTQERKGYAAKGHGMGERARRWEKAGEIPEAPASGKRPFAPKSSGFKPGGSKFRGAKPFGSKAPGSKFGSPKPWQSRSSAGEGGEDRPKPWRKFEGAGASKSEARGGDRKPYAAKAAGFKPRGAKPWAAKSGDGEFSPRTRAPREAGDRPKPWQRDRAEAGDRPTGRKSYGKSSGFKPSGFTRSGFKSAGARSSEARSADSESRPMGEKPWVSKGASSRVGSAKSYAARSAGKPFTKPGGAKPWAKRTAASGGEEAPPKRRDRKEGSGAPREKSGSKPFWAKNPRGGTGSTAAGRSNRPHGKKAARKSGKKK